MRNPDNAMGYNKSIYFAYLVMVREDLFNKDTLARVAKNAGINKLASEIPNFDKKQQERSKIEKEAKEAGKKEKTQPSSKIIKSKNLLGDISDPFNLRPKITKIVGSTKKTQTTKKVKKR